jgi:RNA polymerase sigma-70 factor (ECF subfamily)
MPDSRIHSSAPAAAPAGKQSRARVWYETYGQAVYSYVRFHVASADEADDVTAETFLKVLAAEERFDPDRGEARVWIFRIAQNTLRDHHRRSRVRRHTSLGAMRDLVADAPTAEERLLWEEEVSRLLSAVGELGARDREIIGLRYGSGMDTSAVAQILGVRESAVRTRLWRALGRLRVLLEDDTA